MAKTLDQLRADAEAADRAYREAAGSGEEKLNAIARQQDASIRPEYKPTEARDEHGNPVKLDKFGNPEWRGGQKIEAARSRPVYTPPLRSKHSEPGAPPPDIDFTTNGTWDQTKDLWLDLVDVITKIEKDKMDQQEREQIVQQIVPSILDRLAAVAPRIDCAFADGPMGRGKWLSMVSQYQLAFNPSKSLERSIGTMRSRTAPPFLGFVLEGAKWLFRRCPSGVPRIVAAQEETPAPVKRRGRPKKDASVNVSNLE